MSTVFAASAFSATSASRMATLASMSTSVFDACHAAVRTAAASAGLASARISAAVARTITSSFVRRARSRRSTVALASGVFAAASAFIVAGQVRRSLSSRYGFHAASGTASPSVPSAVTTAARTVQSGSGSTPDSTCRNSGPSIAASAVTAAARMVGEGSPSRSSSRSIAGAAFSAPSAVTISSCSAGSSVGSSSSATSGAIARGSPRRPRPRTACSRTAGRGVADASTSSSGGTAIAGCFDRPESLRGERRAVEPVALEQDLQRRQRPRILGAAQREGDRPPLAPRPALGVEDRRQQHVRGLEPHQRVDAEPARVGLGRERPAELVGLDAGERAAGDEAGDVGPDRRGRRGVADQAERLRGASADERRGVAVQDGEQRRHRRLVAEQPEPERSRLPDARLRIAEQRLQRRPSRRVADAADGEGGAPPQIRVGPLGDRGQVARRIRPRRAGRAGPPGG